MENETEFDKALDRIKSSGLQPTTMLLVKNCGGICWRWRTLKRVRKKSMLSFGITSETISTGHQMPKNPIKDKYKKLQGVLLKYHKGLRELQQLCQHPDAKTTSGGNTGNYDPTSDMYWTTRSCPDCMWSHTEYKASDGRPVKL